MRPLTRSCQLCLTFTHHTVNCWVQEKNKEYRSQNWKDTRAEELATIDKAKGGGHVEEDHQGLTPWTRRLVE